MPPVPNAPEVELAAAMLRVVNQHVDDRGNLVGPAGLLIPRLGWHVAFESLEIECAMNVSRAKDVILGSEVVSVVQPVCQQNNLAVFEVSVKAKE